MDRKTNVKNATNKERINNRLKAQLSYSDSTARDVTFATTSGYGSAGGSNPRLRGRHLEDCFLS
jgi:hypothetical protein